MSYDTIIRNGRWFDGTGAPPSGIRDIGIRDGRIAAVSLRPPLDVTGCDDVVEAGGRWVLPGWWTSTLITT